MNNEKPKPVAKSELKSRVTFLLESAGQETDNYSRHILEMDARRQDPLDKRGLLKAIIESRDDVVNEYLKARKEFKTNDNAGLDDMYDICEKFNNCLRRETAIYGYKLGWLLEMNYVADRLEFYLNNRPLKQGEQPRTIAIKIDAHIKEIDEALSGVSGVDEFRSEINEYVTDIFRDAIKHDEPYSACFDIFEVINVTSVREYIDQQEADSMSLITEEAIKERDINHKSLVNRVYYVHYLIEGFDLCQTEIEKAGPPSIKQIVYE